MLNVIILIIASLLSGIHVSLEGYINKINRDKQYRPQAYTLQLAVKATLGYLIYMLLFGWHTIQTTSSWWNWKGIIYLVVVGLTSALYNTVTFKSYNIGIELSRYISIDSASIVVSLILGWVFLNQRMPLFSLLGVLIIIIGVFLMMVKKSQSDSKSELKASTYFWPLLAAILLGARTILMKEALDCGIPLLIVALGAFAVQIIPYIKTYYKEAWKIFISSPILVFLSGLIIVIGWSGFNYSLITIPAGIAQGVFLSIILLTGLIFGTKKLKEEKNMMKYAGAVFCMVGIAITVMLAK